MGRLLPTARGGRHLEAPQVHALASETGVGNGVVVAAGLESKYVGAAASSDMAQAAALAKEAASRGGVRILGAELGHAVR
jgi:hypothetical protein